MIAVTLQRWLKAYFPSSIVAKYRGILNYSCNITKRIEASLPFSVGKKIYDSLLKQIAWFRTQGTLFSDLFSFEIQRRKLSFKKCAWSSKLNKSEKLRLEFGTKRFHANHWVKVSAPGVRTSHRWILNFKWRIFLTRIIFLRSELWYHFFCWYSPCYLPRFKSFYSVSQMGPSQLMISFLIPRLIPWFFNKNIFLRRTKIFSVVFH